MVLSFGKYVLLGLCDLGARSSPPFLLGRLSAIRNGKKKISVHSANDLTIIKEQIFESGRLGTVNMQLTSLS